MAKADASFIGKGRIFAGPYAANAAALEIGNCSKLEFAVSQETKELLNYSVAGGGKANRIYRITGCAVSAVAHDFDADNLAMVLYGTKAAVTEAAVVDEAVTCYKGGFSPTANLIKTSVAPVVKHTSGTPTYVAGTDYEVTDGGIIIPLVGSAIVDAQSVKVSYTKRASNVVQALLNSGQEWKMHFVGLNEAQSGKPVQVIAHRVKFSPSSGVPLIGDDFGQLPIEGECLADGSQAGGVSQYFTWRFAT